MNQTRREFLGTSAMSLTGLALDIRASEAADPIIDIHQHLGYTGRTDAALLAHQRTLGVTMTILLPAGRPVARPSTHNGVANGLEAKALGNDDCHDFASKHRGEYRVGANEVPDLEEARGEIIRGLKRGAVVIGEQKFGVECDSPAMQRIYELAQEHQVPVLMHWQHQRFNLGFDRFHSMLAKYPKVNFIGHAQTWWANIDRSYTDQSVLYPKGRVAPGGLTDRYLADYANMYGDLSAGSGLGALTRDEEFSRGFLARHQDKLLFGSDCNDSDAGGPKCLGSQIIAAVRRLAPDAAVERKLLYANAARLFKLPEKTGAEK